MPQLQAGISVQSLQQDPNFVAMPPDLQVQYLNEEFLPKADPTFNQLSPELKQQYIRDEVMPQLQPTQVQGLKGGFVDVQTGSQIKPLEGLGRIAQGLGNWAISLPGQVNQAFQAERQNVQDSSLDQYLALPGMAAEGVRNLAQMPADLLAAGQNAYFNTDQFQPMYTLPSIKDAPLYGRLVEQVQQRHPVLDFIAQSAVPVESGLGALGKAAKRISPTGRALAQMKKARKIAVQDAQAARMQVGNKGIGQWLAQQALTEDVHKAVQESIKEARAYQGIDSASTIRTRSQILREQYNLLESKLKELNPSFQSGIRKAQKELQSEFEAGRSSIKPQKMKPRYVQEGTADFNALADYAEGLRAAGRAKEADVALGTLDRETRAKIYDTVKRREVEQKTQAAAQKQQERIQASEKVKADKDRQRQIAKEEAESIKRQKQLEADAKNLQNLKEKQAAKDRLALERAESANRRRELKQLSGSIKERANEQKTQAKQQDGPANSNSKNKPEGKTGKTDVEPSTKGKAVAQTQASKLKEIRKTIDNKHGLRLEYEAEKTGETGSYRFKTVSPYEVSVNKSGVVQLRAVNEEGQIRTYLLGDTSGSKIVSAESTGKAAKHEIFTNDKGKIQARTIEGTTVEQVAKQGVKSSEIRANLSKMQSVLDRVKKGEVVSTQEIIDAARLTKEFDGVRMIDELPDVSRNNLIEEFGC